MAKEASPVDLGRPLLPQVGALGAGYDAWVHRSVRSAGSLRIFTSDRLETLSHVRWWVVPLVWVPIAGLLLVGGVLRGGFPAAVALGLALAGLLVWTLLEYLLHRFVFHHKPKSSLGRRLHFLAHGIHHLDPWDATRLVFPPPAALLLAVPVFVVLLLLAMTWSPAPLATAMVMMAGLLAGYVAYDMTHYYAHHAKPRNAVGRFLKRYHLEHHHKHWERLFGVSTPLWDLVFRTGRPK